MNVLKDADLKDILLSPQKEKEGGLTCINGSIHKIKVINSNSFSIGDTTKFD